MNVVKPSTPRLLVRTAAGTCSSCAWPDVLGLRTVREAILFALLALQLAIAHGATSGGAVSGSGAEVRRGGSPGATSLVVLYPMSNSQYQAIFDAILEGIEARSRLPVHRIRLHGNFDAVEVMAILRRNNAKTVVALGRHSFEAALHLDKDVSIVVGAIVSSPSTSNRLVSGVSLTVDPYGLFSKLKQLRPTLKRVMVTFSPDQNDWVIGIAREAARMLGLELIAYPARDLSGAAQAYRSMFEIADSRFDAIWIPQDKLAGDNETIMPVVLQQSWSRSIPVISSIFSHVTRGALVAPAPNTRKVGASLADIAEGIESGGLQRAPVGALRDVDYYINTRVANHLGIPGTPNRIDFIPWSH